MPASRILILGGTRDARQLAEALVAEGHPVVTSLAGATSQPLLPPGELRVGGFGGVDGLKSYLENSDFAVVVDATHPYAARMSANAFAACARLDLPLLRLERPAWEPGPGDRWISAASAVDAAERLPAAARVLLTTGRKDLQPFFERSDISGIARMIEAAPVDPPAGWQVLRERPPFTLASERALIAGHAISHLVTKNAGGSATQAKLVAARQAGIPVIMIARPAKPEVPGSVTIGNLMSILKRQLSP